MQQVTCELSERVQLAIGACPYISGNKLRFDTREGRVRMRGTVSSFYQKQMAQEAVRRVEGVEAIDNDLEVAWN